MNFLGEAVRSLLLRRGLTGAQLGNEIGLSATSVSRIIQGHSKPRQVTVSRLMRRLCVTADEEQMLVRAFTGLPGSIAEESSAGDTVDLLAGRERVERWLEARTQAIVFKNAVAKELDKAAISYQRDVCDGIASADFVVRRGGQRIAVECKFNVRRDFDKTVGIAHLLCELLRCNRAIIVVPFVDDAVEAATRESPEIRACTPADAVIELRRVAS